MIDPVHSSGGAQAPSSTASSGSSPSTSFAEVHAAALSQSVQAPPAPPSGEQWAPVAGVTWYAKITAGPRKGQYIDLGHGARHGQAFTIEDSGGKTVHVYGSGADAETVDATTDERQEAAKLGRAAKAAAAADPPGKGEDWAPVAGHWGYADILDGPRNGLWVNISGNARSGRAFQIVNRGGRTYHIYGTGKNREVIVVSHHPSSGPAKKPASGSHGGVSAG